MLVVEFGCLLRGSTSEVSHEEAAESAFLGNGMCCFLLLFIDVNSSCLVFLLSISLAEKTHFSSR